VIALLASPATAWAASVWWRPQRAGWWMALLFAVGSAAFALASVASQWASASRPGIGVTFFAASICFTAAAALQLRSARGADRLPSLVQLAGTLAFNVSTFAGMESGLDARQADLRVWTPDVLGSICFLVASGLAYAAVRGRPNRSRGRRIAVLNLAGSVAFGVAAAAALVEPSTSEPVSAAVANAATTIGALCFLAGAVLLVPENARGEQRVVRSG
jgi:hypothetical protein